MSKKMLCRKNRHSQAGFSLISMSLLIIVVGILTAGGILLGKQYSFTEKENISNTNIGLVQQALEDYKATNGRLPCPAPLNVDVDQPNFGVALTTCSVTGSGTFVVSGRVIAGVAQPVSYGAVPVRSLGLPDKVMMDGWNHRLVYTVTQYYTTTSPKPDFDADKGAITILDANNVKMANTAPDSITYAIISPGADDRGAYSMSGMRLDNCSGSAQDLSQTNCNKEQAGANATFRSAIMRQWDTGASTLTSTMKYGSEQTAYYWKANDWDTCKCPSSETDNNPIQTRVGSAPTVTCMKKGGGVVADSFCLGLTKPPATQPCTAFCWKVDPPAVCNCDTKGAVHSETLHCLRKFDGTADELDRSECDAYDVKMGNPVKVALSVTCADPGYCDACSAPPAPPAPPPSTPTPTPTPTPDPTPTPQQQTGGGTWVVLDMCPTGCGFPAQTITAPVVCSQGGMSVSDSLCTGPKPSGQKSCPATAACACTGTWTVGPWTGLGCAGSALIGTRTVTCTASCSNPTCDAATKPTTTPPNDGSTGYSCSSNKGSSGGENQGFYDSHGNDLGGYKFGGDATGFGANSP